MLVAGSLLATVFLRRLVPPLLGEPDSLSLGGAPALQAWWAAAAQAAGGWRLLHRDAG